MVLSCWWSPSALADESAADARFRQLWEADWQWRLRQDPQMASSIGEGDYDGQLEQVDEASQHARGKYWRDLASKLKEIDPAQLSKTARADYAVFEHQIQSSLDEVRFHGYRMPMNGDSSFYGSIQYWANRLSLESPEAAENYLKRLAALPNWYAQHIDNMRAGIEHGQVMPKIVLAGRDQPLVREAELSDPTHSVFYAPLAKLPQSWPAAEREDLGKRAARLIGEKVLPAQRTLLAFLREEYLPAGRDSIGAKELPDGMDYYRAQIRRFVTVDMAPEEIHQIGLAEVARIRAQMEAIVAELDFDGSFAEFLSFLRTDPQFYAASPHQLLAEASYYAKLIDGKLPDYFSTLPRAPYGVAPVPDSIAPFYTAGRYVPPAREGGAGTYWVNTHKLESRPLYALPALTLHEAVPGHHLQGALASELSEQPPFRRYSYLSVYGEGWALYTEWLGQEMGVYQTPYEHFGRLTYEMWRACRLVVDTGMHTQGWSRQRAYDYMKDNTALSEHEIGTEIDRYIGWPGQALSYKLGELEIRKLRAQAEAELGPAFDLKAFHAAILSQGSVTLPVLREAVGEYLQAQKNPDVGSTN